MDDGDESLSMWEMFDFLNNSTQIKNWNPENVNEPKGDRVITFVRDELNSNDANERNLILKRRVNYINGLCGLLGLTNIVPFPFF